jgi:hypothetical protein
VIATGLQPDSNRRQREKWHKSPKA